MVEIIMQIERKFRPTAIPSEVKLILSNNDCP